MSEKIDPSIYKTMFTEQEKLDQIEKAQFNWNPPQPLRETINCQQCHWSFTGLPRETEIAQNAHICYPKHINFVREIEALKRELDRRNAQSDAVRRLHKPMVKDVNVYCEFCVWDGVYPEPYPCETIKLLLEEPKQVEGFSWTVGTDETND